ncbi:hypothetical protein [Acinetobacter sp.]|uniref:hypothetical protein n=1 Tax=Acinetobacter sp. TaxID=472 RepID=UPI003D073484
MRYLKKGFMAEDTILDALYGKGIRCQMAPKEWDHRYKVDIVARVGDTFYLIQVKAGDGLKETRPVIPDGWKAPANNTICKVIHVCGDIENGNIPADELMELLTSDSMEGTIWAI